MNSETTTGCLLDTLAANFKNCSNSVLLEQTFIAAPERTYEGLTKTGKPTISTKSFTSDNVDNSFHLGWSIIRVSNKEENLCLSSALSIFFALVPSSTTPTLSNLRARLLGI